MNILVTMPNYCDSASCCINDGLLSLGHKVYCTNERPLNYVEPAYMQGMYDLWLMMDTDNYGMLGEQYYNNINDRTVKVIMHLHDRWTQYDNIPDAPLKVYDINSWRCDLAFIRDWDGRRPSDGRFMVFPLDYAIETRFIEACDQYRNELRENKIIFHGTLTTARREQRLKTMEAAGIKVEYSRSNFSFPDSKWSKWIYGRYTHDSNYYKELCKALFVFCPLGGGPSTMRLGEVYAAGSIPVIQKYPSDIIPLHKFLDNENCILWETEEELIEKVKYYMDRPEEAEELRLKCYNYGMENLLSRHLAKYILDTIGDERYGV